MGAFSLAVQIALPWYTSATPSLNTKSSFSACKSNLLFWGYFYDKQGKSLCCGIEISDLEKTFKKDKKHYIYFASIQDLLGSKIAGGKFDKNDEVFNIDWNIAMAEIHLRHWQTRIKIKR